MSNGYYLVRYSDLHYSRERGWAGLAAFLCWLASGRSIAPVIRRQALVAIRFIYREIQDRRPRWIDDMSRPKARQRVPVVFSGVGAARLPACLEGVVIHHHAQNQDRRGVAAPFHRAG